MALKREEILSFHVGGKIRTALSKPLCDLSALCKAYTPGVAVPVEEIMRDRSLLYRYTVKSNLVGVVSDGTAVLGLGDTGCEASIPVLEGKAVLFKAFADIDGWPVPLGNCRKGGVNTGRTDPERLIETVCALSCLYGGINLEDIAAPACFEIEDRLEELLDIPVFHDDQWGTAVITLAGVVNYCHLSGRDIAELKVVINGAGAAGIRIAEMLKDAGARSVTLCDSKGVVRSDRKDLNPKKRQHAVDSSAGTVSEALRGAHVFVGVSVGGCITPEEVLSMASYPCVFAMANPCPEVQPEAVAGAMGKRPYVIATGRSDYPNQVNNVLGFPFLFRGALDVNACRINMEMKKAASRALAAVARREVPEGVKKLYPQEELEFGRSYVIPKPFDPRLFVEVSYAVGKAAIESGVAAKRDLKEYYMQLEERNRLRLKQ